MLKRIFIVFACFSLYFALPPQANAHPDTRDDGTRVPGTDNLTSPLDAKLLAVIREKINKPTGYLSSVF